MQEPNKSTKIKEVKMFIKDLGNEVKKREQQIAEFWDKALPIYQEGMSAGASFLDIVVKIMGSTKGGDQAVRDCAAIILGVPKIDHALHKSAVLLFSPDQNQITVKGDCLSMWVKQPNIHSPDLKYSFRQNLATVILEQTVTQEAENYLLSALTLAEINFATFETLQKLPNQSDPQVVRLSTEAKGRTTHYSAIGYINHDNEGKCLPKEYLTRLNKIMKKVTTSYIAGEKDFLLNLSCEKCNVSQIKSAILSLMMLSRSYCSKKNSDYLKATICLEKVLEFMLFLENKKALLPNSESKGRIVNFCMKILYYLAKKLDNKTNQVADKIRVLIEVLSHYLHSKEDEVNSGSFKQKP